MKKNLKNLFPLYLFNFDRLITCRDTNRSYEFAFAERSSADGYEAIKTLNGNKINEHLLTRIMARIKEGYGNKKDFS